MLHKNHQTLFAVGLIFSVACGGPLEEGEAPIEETAADELITNKAVRLYTGGDGSTSRTYYHQCGSIAYQIMIYISYGRREAGRFYLKEIKTYAYVYSGTAVMMPLYTYPQIRLRDDDDWGDGIGYGESRGTGRWWLTNTTPVWQWINYASNNNFVIQKDSVAGFDCETYQDRLVLMP